MKRVSLTIVITLLFISCSKGSDTFDHFRQLPSSSKHELKNGMTVFILEDPSLPTFRLQLFHRGGSVWESKGREGLASLTAELLRIGGTKKQTPDEIEEMIRSLSAKIEFGASKEQGSIALNVLKQNRYQLLDLLSQILMEPRFDAKALSTARQQAIISLRQVKDKAHSLASFHFPSLVYGSQSPWAAMPTEEGLTKLTIEDVRAYYERYYRPNETFVAIAGNFKSRELLKELNTTLGQWTNSPQESLAWPKISAEPPRSLFIDKEASQVTIRIGHVGLERTHPDKFALLIANYILGGSGSMTSRLGAKIRTAEGKAYSIWSHFGFGRVPSIFRIQTQTESSQVIEVIEAIKEVLTDLRNNGISESELTNAKEAIIRSLLFQYETRFSISKSEAQFAFWGYKPNYLKQFVKEIESVDLKKANNVIRQYFDPGSLSMIIVGPDRLWPQLQKLSHNIERLNKP